MTSKHNSTLPIPKLKNLAVFLSDYRSANTFYPLPFSFCHQCSNESRYWGFEQWAKLAKENPQALEQARQEAIKNLINRLPANQTQRLKALQWRIDKERVLAESPYDSASQLHRLLREKLTNASRLIETLKRK